MLLNQDFVFTSESVTEGHPDKVCDYISDAVLDACLGADPNPRVACECLAKSDMILLAGEITVASAPDYHAVVRAALADIDARDTRYRDTVDIRIVLTEQSAEIAEGVDRRRDEKVGGAGKIGAFVVQSSLSRCRGQGTRGRLSRARWPWTQRTTCSRVCGAHLAP